MVIVLLQNNTIVYIIMLTSVSDFTELSIVNNISIEHNMHADLSILALPQALHGV